MNLIKQVAQHLEMLGFGIVNDAERSGNIFWGVVPDQPDRCIGVLSTDSQFGGSPQGARVQIIVRDVSVKGAYELSQEIAEALCDFDGYLGGDGAHAAIEVVNASAGLGPDTKKREIYSSNIMVRYCNF